jgi:outer membrane protein assembly factor BamB
MFVAANNGAIARLDAGRETWRINTKAKLSAGVGVGGGRLVVGSEEGDVLAYDLDGKPLWQAKVSSEIIAAPVANDKLVLVRTTDNRIHALNASDGKRRWVFQRSAPPLVMRNAGSILLTDSVAYAGFAGGKLVAIDLANGGPNWEATIAFPRGATELERVADVAGEPVSAARSICAVAYQGRIGCADQQSGAVAWARNMSSANGLAVDGRTLFFSDEAGNIFALDATTGATLWRQDKLAGRSPSRPAVISRGVVVVDGEGVVYLLSSSDGNLLAADRGGRLAAPPLAVEGAIVLQEASGRVRALTAK